MRRSAFARMVLLLGSLAISLLISELGLRLWKGVRGKALGNLEPAPIRLDDRLGWRVSGNYRDEWTNRDIVGRKFEVRYSTDSTGFRVRGPSTPDRPTLLIVGDSFTQGAGVSDADLYGAVIQREANLSVYSWGTGGYGTLQELMVLDELLSKVRPDALLLQFCSNDFIDVDERLERASRWNNNGRRRPYLGSNHEVYYALPRSQASLRQFFWTHSVLLSLAMSEWNRILARSSDSVEAEIRKEGPSHPGFRRAAHTMDELLHRIRALATPIPVFAFDADSYQVEDSTFQALSRRNDIVFIDGIPAVVQSASDRGVPTTLADRKHWSPTGNAIAGIELAIRLRTALTRIHGASTLSERVSPDSDSRTSVQIARPNF